MRNPFNLLTVAATEADKSIQVLVRYQGPDDEAETYGVFVEAYIPNGDADMIYVSETSGFDNEPAALDYVEVFTRGMAERFLDRNR